MRRRLLGVVPVILALLSSCTGMLQDDLDLTHAKLAALAYLQPYADYNTAIAYMGLDRNYSALDILSGLKSTASVNYLLAIVHSRLGDEQEAVQHYLLACRQDNSFVHRGNLDPEIAQLIKTYRLNEELSEYAPPTP